MCGLFEYACGMSDIDLTISAWFIVRFTLLCITSLAWSAANRLKAVIYECVVLILKQMCTVVILHLQ